MDTLTNVPVELLRSGEYNRLIDQRHVLQLVNAYRDRPNAMPPIECNTRENGDLIVCNGQHRAAAAKILGWATIPAIVHYGWSEEEEARAFRDTARAKPIHTLALWRAERLAGDADILAVEAIMQQYGLSIARSSRTHADCNISTAPRALLHAARANGRSRFKAERLTATLDFLITVWPTDRDRLNSDMVRIVYTFLVQVQANEHYSLHQATRRLGAVTVEELLKKARILHQVETIPLYQAGVRVMYGLYDHGRQKNRLAARQPLQQSLLDA